MLHQEGNYTIFVLQHYSGNAKKWANSSLDYFYCVSKAFSAFGNCWQTTGLHGCFVEDEARECLDAVRKKNPTVKFRIAKFKIQQRTIPMGW